MHLVERMWQRGAALGPVAPAWVCRGCFRLVRAPACPRCNRPPSAGVGRAFSEAAEGRRGQP